MSSDVSGSKPGLISAGASLSGVYSGYGVSQSETASGALLFQRANDVPGSREADFTSLGVDVVDLRFAPPSITLEMSSEGTSALTAAWRSGVVGVPTDSGTRAVASGSIALSTTERHSLATADLLGVPTPAPLSGVGSATAGSPATASRVAVCTLEAGAVAGSSGAQPGSCPSNK
eukprot:2385069-Prymnesium_polylepis.2